MEFKQEETDERTTIVTVRHLGQDFVGVSRLHPDDKKYYSAIVGGTIAEARATVKALKYELAIMKEKYKIQANFVKACEQYKNFDSSSATARVMYRQLNRLRKDINETKADIDEINEIIKNDINRRTKFLASIEERAKKDNE